MADLKHPVVEIAALTSVARSVFAQLEAVGAKLDKVNGILATVEAWLAGDKVTRTTLARQAKAGHNGFQHFWNLKGVAKSPFWAGAVAGRLCAMAANGRDDVKETLTNLTYVLDYFVEHEATRRFTAMLDDAKVAASPRRPGAVAKKVAAWASVFGAVFAEGRDKPAAPAKVLADVDAWLAGKSNERRLTDSMKAARKLSNAKWPSATAYLASSIADLAALALGESQHSDDISLDNVRDVVSLRGDAGGQVHARYEAAKTAIRATKTPVPATAVPTAAPRRPGVGIAELEAKLGPVITKILQNANAEREPTRQADAKKLTALLKKRGYRAHHSVIAFEAAYGGLLLPTPGYSDWYDEGEYTCFGAYASLFHWTDSPKGSAEQTSIGLVPVARVGDVVYFLDAEGCGWGQDLIGDAAAVRSADRPDCLVARVVLWTVMWAVARGSFGKRTKQSGAAVAKRKRLAPLTHATDSFERWWGNANNVVQQMLKPPGGTIVASLAGLAKKPPRARARPHQ